MDSIKFLSKKNASRYTTWSVLVPILIIFAAYISGIDVNMYFVYLIASIFSFVSVINLARKASRSVEEIIISNDKIKIYFFNKMKDPVELTWKEFTFLIEQDCVVFYYKLPKKLIATASKSTIEESWKWDVLVEHLKKLSR